MIRCIRKLFTLAVVLVLLAAFGYSVVLPRVLPLQYRDIVEQYAAEYGGGLCVWCDFLRKPF